MTHGMDELKNGETAKDLFLTNYTNDTTKSYYNRIFTKAEQMEETLNKDLYDFTLEEIEELLIQLRGSAQATEVYGRVISAYMKWAVENNYKQTKNPLLDVSAKWFENISENVKNLYITKKQLLKIESDCYNYQDSTIIRLLFEGICGEKAIEIRELKKSDVEQALEFMQEKGLNSDIEDTKVPLNIGGAFTEVDARTVLMLEQAMQEKRYWKKNGDMEQRENIRAVTELVDNEYVFRPSITRTGSYHQAIKESVIYRRVNLIGEVLGYPQLKTKSIIKSGQLYMAKKIMEEKGEYYLSTEDYKNIAIRFDINNFYPMKKYCNVKNIKELYGDFLGQDN